jgi:hypothetical protein
VTAEATHGVSTAVIRMPSGNPPCGAGVGTAGNSAAARTISGAGWRRAGGRGRCEGRGGAGFGGAWETLATVRGALGE